MSSSSMRNSRVMFKALDVQSPPHGHLQYLIPSQPLCLTRFRLKVPHDLNGVGASRALGAEQLSLSFVAGVVEHSRSDHVEATSRFKTAAASRNRTPTHCSWGLNGLPSSFPPSPSFFESLSDMGYHEFLGKVKVKIVIRRG